MLPDLLLLDEVLPEGLVVPLVRLRVHLLEAERHREAHSCCLVWSAADCC